ncbi:MAG: hypothetical protein NDJ89_06700 [Oligoflexia bacterium]|nr:hypothetical protein [Oligoflexia bacterium]
MTKRLILTLAAFWTWIVLVLVGGLSLAQEATQSTAPAPLSDYTAAVVGYVLLIGFLVSVLLIGGLLVLNLGMMSKRREDRVGRRTPSDIGILKGNVWPEEISEERSLPAEEDEQELARVRARRERFRLGRMRFRKRGPAA